MKTRICSSWVLGLVLLVLPLAGCLQESSISSQETIAAADVSSPPETPTVESAPENSADSDMEEALAQADDQNISTAPAKKVSSEIQVPANLRPSPATAEIIKLANAGVAESVMLSFVTNSVGTFNLRAEEIIYLNDIGIPSGVVTAMIQRDHLLQDSNLTMGSGDFNLSEAVTNTSSVYTPPAPPLEMSQAQAPAFDSAPGYSSTDYTVPADYSEPAPADYMDYNDALAPYGTWVDVAGYGRCWQPTVVAVNPGWRPYFNSGRWVYTDCGWYWMSDYSWGWAPFHYGRWFQHATLGWCWRPDRVWGPSWVCWRQSGDFCGWAPLPPCAGFVASIGLTFNGHPARQNFSFGLGAGHFRFVHTSHFMDRDVARHVVPRDHSARIFEHAIASTGIESHNHRVMNNGIPREHVASAIQANIVPATLHNVPPADGVGVRERFERNGRTLAVYRPDLQQRTVRADALARENQPPPNNGSAGSSIPSHARLTQIQPQQPIVALHPAQSTTHVPRPVRGGNQLEIGRGVPTAPVGRGQPLIVRGSEHSGETAIAPDAVGTSRSISAANSQNTRRAVPLSSLVEIGEHRDSRVASTQPNNRPSWNSQNRTSPSSNRDMRHNVAQNPTGEDDMRYENRQSQTPAQPGWWSQPTQPRTSGQEQFRHNRDTTVRGGGNWNASVEQPRHNPTPIQVPQQTYSAPAQSHQQHFAPVESRPAHTAPMESHQSQPTHVETHQSPPVESRASQPAPASAPSSSSSSSSSSGRGR